MLTRILKIRISIISIIIGVMTLLIFPVGGFYISPALAVPTLQLYIEGATYDDTSETWVTTSSEFTLWVIGEVDDGNPIYDVKLSVAYLSAETGSISFTPTTTSLITDPSISSNPILIDSGIGDAPLMGNGDPLPSHGIYGDGTSWDTYSIGDFTMTDSPIGDFDKSPLPLSTSGQINAYDVAITGYSWIHFDAFDHIIKGNTHLKFKKAPFSHDGESSPTTVPEPSTLILGASGALFGFVYRRLFSS